MPGQLLKLYGGGFSPAQYSPALWLDASDQSTMYQERTGASATTLVTADSDPIGTWLDKSGNARHVTAASDAARPTFKTGIQNGRSVVLFDGTDDSLSGANFDLNLSTKEISCFVVAQANSNTENNYISLRRSGYIDYTSGLLFQGRSSSVLRATLGNGTNGYLNQNASSYTQTSFSVLSLKATTSAVEMAINGSSRTVTDPGGSTDTLANWLSLGSGNHKILIGARFISSVGTFSQKYISEVLIYSSALSTSQRQQVERYLASKWGITLS